MKKRGISPLIATVLIIGFTIVLAALVMQWGGGLFNKIKGESDIESQKSLACSNINLNIISVKTDFFNSNITLDIESLSEQKVSGFLIRLTGEVGSDSITKEKQLGIGELKKISSKFNMVKTGLVKTIEIFPKIIIDNKTFICENKFIKNVLNYDVDNLEIDSIYKIWDDGTTNFSGAIVTSEDSYSGEKSLFIQSNGCGSFNIPPTNLNINLNNYDDLIFAYKDKVSGLWGGLGVNTNSGTNSGNIYLGCYSPCSTPGGWYAGFDISRYSGGCYFGTNWKPVKAEFNKLIKGSNQNSCLSVTKPNTLNSVVVNVCSQPPGTTKSAYYDMIYLYKLKR